MGKFILALDQGTTSSRAIVFDDNGMPVGQYNREFPQIFPEPGWVEHNPDDIIYSQITALREVIAQERVNPCDIAAVGITNQRETVMVWDRETGRPVYNAIVWQCRRTADYCEQLQKQGLTEMIRSKTGLIIDAYFSATKIKWVLDNVEGARALAEQGRLLAGTVDTWVVWNLSGRKAHVTDYTNASRTMLYNIYDMCWDDELLELFGIPACMLPKVVPSSGVAAMMDSSILGVEIPIAGIAGDQQAALFGQCCFEAGEAKNTYGTGCFLLMNTGHEPIHSQYNLLTTLAATAEGGERQYALEGSVFVSGAAIQWLRDELRILDDAAQSNQLAESIPDTGGVVMVPAFTGLGAPYWDMYSRGMILGITRGTGRAHIVRAALESIAYQSYDVLTTMMRDTGREIQTLRVDGGASANNFLMQFQSDILDCRVLRPAIVETTALGAAYLAGLACGIWEDKESLRAKWALDREFTPQMQSETRVKLTDGWKRAVQAVLFASRHASGDSGLEIETEKNR